jgi:uncharacterized protein (DUF924 family)
MVQPSAHQVLTFWFDDPTAPDSEYGQQRRIWFQKDPDFDSQIREHFLSTYEQARRGEHDDWQTAPNTALALILVLDQFPRNMFRGTAKSFETDGQALQIAQAAIAQGYDQALLPVERMFFYLPFEHSEHIDHQHQAVALFEALVAVAPDLQATLDYAYRHRDVIARFNRFPHRNAILGRGSTPAEKAFLQEPGSRF